MATTLAVSNIQKRLGIPNPDALPPGEELPPGHMRLYDNWMPALPAGDYSIEATQTISGTAAGQKFNDTTIENAPTGTETQSPGKQLFDVIAPQFSLDPSLITSYYPPDGHQDEGRILPHIAFSDPHVPWLRPAGKTPWMSQKSDRKYLPWLALMVFKAEDLRVEAKEAISLKLDTITTGKTAPPDGSSSASPVEKKVYDPANLPTTGAYGMAVGDYLKTITSRVKYEESADIDDLKQSTDKTSIIFPLKSQLQSIFDPNNDGQLSGIDAQKLLTHVRQLNTVGCPDAGVSGHGFYSIVVSTMTGDLTITSPTTHIVHLVSLEHLDATITPGNGTDRIGVVSLFSWAYHCIPEAVNFEEMMKNLGNQSQPLRPPKEQMVILESQAQGDTPTAKAAAKLYKRLNSGYTIARWRAPSGEESVAFNRGPLVPMEVPEVPGGSSAWPAISMTGRDYLIFDESIGMIDATYASAWSLGKLLAISDPAFNAALLRFRSSIWNAATSQVRMDSNGVPQWANTLGNAVTSVAKGADLSSGNFSGSVQRINKPAAAALAPSVDHPSMAENLASAIEDKVTSAASVPGSKDALYNGFLLQSASSSDWEIIYNWIYDVMFLGHIPAHVLFPEPSHLKSSIQMPTLPDQTKFQPEALRFFYVDNAWVDCFLDGALSCANHVEPQYDNIRIKVKEIFNDVLSRKIGKLDDLPPVPRYGFILRSAAVKSTPDIKLTVRCWASKSDDNNPGKYVWEIDQDRDPLLRHTKLDDTTILSLVDCLPGEISYIELAQPAHQQRFAFGVDVTIDPTTGNASNIVSDIDIIKLYTDSTKAPPYTEAGDGTKLDPGDPEYLEWKALPTQLTSDEQKDFYHPDSRRIDATGIYSAITDKLTKWGAQNGCFVDSESVSKGNTGSSIFGLEMNDRAYHFIIPGTKPTPDTKPFPSWKRQIWAGSTKDPSNNTQMAEKAMVQSKSSIPAPAPAKFATVAVAAPTAPPKTVPAISNRSSAVPISTSPIPQINPKAPPSTKFPIQVNPWTPSQEPEFELLVHPDYRPPPPRPETANNTWVFSVVDVLPTRTQYLYDLVFSIRRRHFADVKRTLRYLHIEIPVSRGSRALDLQDLDGNGHRAREPLVAPGFGTHGGVRIASNQRFVASLFEGPAGRINDGRWDGQDVLLITLTPRSGQEDGTMALLADSKSSAVAVRLAETVLAEVVSPETLAVYKNAPGGGVTKDRVSGVAHVPIRLTEIYGDNFPMQWSWCMAVKADKGDPIIDNSP